jgi:hypothetical protein
MMPKFNTVTGAGLIKIAQASLTKSNLVSGITSLTKLNNTDNVSLRDVLMSATITDGRLSVKPFNVKFGDYVTTISGSSGLDKSIDYTLKMMVPAGQLGSQFQGFLNQATGSQNSTSEIPVTIGLTGLFSAPKATLLMQEQKQQVKDAVTNVAVDKGKEVLKDVIKDTPAKDLVNGILGAGAKKDSTKADTTKADPVKEALQNKLNKFFRKKNN